MPSFLSTQLQPGGLQGTPRDFLGVRGRTNPYQFDSTNPYLTPVPADYSQEESAQDTIFRLLRDRLAGSTARYNRLGSISGATFAGMSQALDPLRQQLGQYDDAADDLSGLTNELMTSSMASTAGAGVAAVGAARMADARFGGGGMAAMLASRGATDAAVGQSAALSQALVQGRLGEANYRSNLLQQRSGVASTLSQILQQQQGLLEERGRLGVAMETEQANILGGALSVYGGIQQGRDQKADRPPIFGLL